MRTPQALHALLLLSFLTPFGGAEEPKREPKTVRVDAHGDPLPDGAIARLGTVRLRRPGPIQALVFSRDGKTLFAATPNSSVLAWDARAGRLLGSLDGSPVDATALVLSLDGSRLAAMGENALSIWDLPSEKLKRKIEPTDGAHFRGLAFSPDDKTLATVETELAGTCRIQFWDTSSGKSLRRFEIPIGADTLIWSSDSKFLAWGTDRHLCLRDGGTGEALWQLLLPINEKKALLFSPDSKLMVIGRTGGVLFIVETATGKLLRQARAAVSALAFAPDGKVFASGGTDAAIRLWDSATGKEIRRLKGHTAEVIALAFTADGKTLASGSSDGTLQLWDVAGGKERFPFTKRDLVSSVAFSPDGKLLASAYRDGTVFLWDVSKDKEPRSLPMHAKAWTYVAFAPDGKTLASAGGDGEVRLCATATGQEIRAFTGHTDNVYAVAFSPDGKLLASGSHDSTIRVWDVSTGKEVRRMGGAKPSCLAFCPDGRLLTSGAGMQGDGGLHQCDFATGKPIRRLEKNEHYSNAVAYSPDGKSFAAASMDDAVLLWEVRTCKELRRFEGHKDNVLSVAIAPDGRTLVSGGRDATARLWEVISGQELLRYSGHWGQVTSVAYSPGGKTIASGSQDGTILIWDATGRHEEKARKEFVGQPEQLERLWEELFGDAPAAHRAIWRLASLPEQAVPFLAGRLKPIARAGPKQIAQLVAELEHNRFQVRQRATADLEALGELAIPSLRAVLAGQPTLEVRRRVSDLLRSLQTPLLPPRRLREARAVAVLEYANTSEARRLLQNLADGAPEALVTQHARAALERLAVSVRKPASGGR
jgi:WD40 repeat protein